MQDPSDESNEAINIMQIKNPFVCNSKSAPVNLLLELINLPTKAFYRYNSLLEL